MPKTSHSILPSQGSSGYLKAEIPDDPACRVWQHEATLRSIASVTEDRLVAVGDRGTVLLTSDGGHQWQLVPAPTSVNLHDVTFVGATGLAVGGWIGRESGMSYGVILRSSDGGSSWEALPTSGLPRLIGIQSQANRLLCWGDYSPQLGTSVFQSLDGGRSWQPAVKGVGQATVARLSESGAIAAVDEIGRAVLGAQPIAKPISQAHLRLRTMVAQESGWIMAGEAGQLVVSHDGEQWFELRLPISQAAQRLCDWQSLFRRGTRLWLAGSPGSLVWHSADEGRTWQASPTGQNLPIFRLCFFDALRGWAVGAQGTILATRDGGKSWYPQRQVPQRAGCFALRPPAPRLPGPPWPPRFGKASGPRPPWRCSMPIRFCGQMSHPVMEPLPPRPPRRSA